MLYIVSNIIFLKYYKKLIKFFILLISTINQLIILNYGVEVFKVEINNIFFI